jgi:hypothetical protein
MPRFLAISLLSLVSMASLAGQTNGGVQLTSGALSVGRHVVGTVSTPQMETATVQSNSAAGVTFGTVAITERFELARLNPVPNGGTQ